MPTTTTSRKSAAPVVVSALSLRHQPWQDPPPYGRRTALTCYHLKKRGTPAAVLLNIRDYVKLAAPEPEVLKIIGDEAKRNKTVALTSRGQIDFRLGSRTRKIGKEEALMLALRLVI